MKKILFVLMYFICTASSCKDSPFVERVYRIKVVNNSLQNIYFFDSRVYPDTSLPTTKPYFGGIGANSFGTLDSKEDWPDIFKKLPNDTLSIFILSNDTVNSYDWNVVSSQYKILKRYDLSLGDLQGSNWTVTYQ